MVASFPSHFKFKADRSIVDAFKENVGAVYQAEAYNRRSRQVVFFEALNFEKAFYSAIYRLM